MDADGSLFNEEEGSSVHSSPITPSLVRPPHSAAPLCSPLIVPKEAETLQWGLQPDDGNAVSSDDDDADHCFSDSTPCEELQDGADEDESEDVEAVFRTTLARQQACITQCLSPRTVSPTSGAAFFTKFSQAVSPKGRIALPTNTYERILSQRPQIEMGKDVEKKDKDEIPTDQKGNQKVAKKSKESRERSSSASLRGNQHSRRPAMPVPPCPRRPDSAASYSTSKVLPLQIPVLPVLQKVGSKRGFYAAALPVLQEPKRKKSSKSDKMSEPAPHSKKRTPQHTATRPAADTFRIEPPAMTDTIPHCTSLPPPITGAVLKGEVVGVSDVNVNVEVEVGVNVVQGRVDSLGLPEGVAERYAELGIEELFAWQRCCLAESGVLEGRNLIYSAPTSGGKTLIAEMAIAMRLKQFKKKKILFIVPYVAMAAEKVPVLQHILEPMGVVVGTQAGGQGNRLLLDDVAVCTVERANSLVNTVLDMGRLDEICGVVVDELHMISDRDRGGLLEIVLTKLLFAHQTNLQIVAMSATLPNASTLAGWLKAHFFATTYRPLPLTESYCTDGCIHTYPNLNQNEDQPTDIKPTKEEISPASTTTERDQDRLMALTMSAVKGGGSVLIFCPTKKIVEATAKRVATYLTQIEVSASRGAPSSPSSPSSTPSDILKAHQESIKQAMEMLKSNPCGPDPALESALQRGVAYHHAGLTVDERDVVERCFREGAVGVLCCTTTLAAGVNLPARRVILNGIRVGIDRMNASRYKQAAGRAGRVNLDTKGEAILLCKPQEAHYAHNLITGPLPIASSTFSSEKRGFVRALGEAVASGIVKTSADIQRYTQCSLFHHQNVETNPEEGSTATAESAKHALEFLEQHAFVIWHTEMGGYFAPSPLAKATFKAGLSPAEAKLVSESLLDARRQFVMSHELHLVFQCTPYATGIEPQWMRFYNLYMARSADVHHVASMLGLNEGALSMAQFKGGAPDCPDRELIVLRRFYSALILYDVVCEVPLHRIVRRYDVNRGAVQRLMDAAAAFSGMVASFAESLNWWGFPSMIAQLQARIRDGVENDIVPLMQIASMKPYRARALYQQGYRTVACVASADPKALDDILSASHPYVKKGVLPEWRPNTKDGSLGAEIVRDAKKILRAEANELEGDLVEAQKRLEDAEKKNDTDASEKRIRVGESYGAPTKSKLYGVNPSHPGMPKKAPSEAPEAAAAEAAPTMQKENAKGLYFQGGVAKKTTKSIANLMAETKRKNIEFFGGDVKPRHTAAAPVTGSMGFSVTHIAVCTQESPEETNFVTTLNATRCCGVGVSMDNVHSILEGNSKGLGGIGYFAVSIATSTTAVFHYVIMETPFNETCFLRRFAVLFSDRFLYRKGLAKSCYDAKMVFKTLFAVLLARAGREGIEGIVAKVSKGFFDPRVAAWMLSPDEVFEGGPHHTIDVLCKKALRGATIVTPIGVAAQAQHSSRHAYISLLLMKTFLEQLKNSSLTDPFFNIEMPFTAVLALMETSGLSFRCDVYKKYETLMIEKAKYLQSRADTMTGYKWNMASPADCARALFDNQGLPAVGVRQIRPNEVEKKRRRTESRSTSAAVLHKLMELRPDHPLPRMIQEHRMLVGWLAKYIQPIPGFVCPDGRIRADFHQTATNTGRLAVIDPSLQTIPHPVEFFSVSGERVKLELRCSFVGSLTASGMVHLNPCGNGTVLGCDVIGIQSPHTPMG